MDIDKVIETLSKEERKVLIIIKATIRDREKQYGNELLNELTEELTKEMIASLKDLVPELDEECVKRQVKINILTVWRQCLNDLKDTRISPGLVGSGLIVPPEFKEYRESLNESYDLMARYINKNRVEVYKPLIELEVLSATEFTYSYAVLESIAMLQIIEVDREEIERRPRQDR